MPGVASNKSTRVLGDARRSLILSRPAAGRRRHQAALAGGGAGRYDGSGARAPKVKVNGLPAERRTMGCLLVYGVVALAAWADFIALRTLARRRAGPFWWAAVAVLLSAGVAAGVWCSCGEYQVSNRVRVCGFPVPVVTFILEDGDWVDYVSPAPLLAAVLNAASVAVLSLLPVSAACFLRRKRP
jgi:hypothetical protein